MRWLSDGEVVSASTDSTHKACSYIRCDKAFSTSGVGAGHRKAVSYVRWLSDGEVVSASTDSTLRLWDIQAARESRVFRGHVNEKNFVGLAADSEFIACGSETNEVATLSQLQTLHTVALW